LSDGLLDVTIWAGFGIIDFVLLTPIVYSGEHVKHAKTKTLRCKTIEVKDVTSTGVVSEVAVELDGETPGALPATFSVLPSVLTLLA
jgi:diacylglycerol kinase family enzyme